MGRQLFFPFLLEELGACCLASRLVCLRKTSDPCTPTDGRKTFAEVLYPNLPQIILSYHPIRLTPPHTTKNTEKKCLLFLLSISHQCHLWAKHNRDLRMLNWFSVFCPQNKECQWTMTHRRETCHVHKTKFLAWSSSNSHRFYDNQVTSLVSCSDSTIWVHG